MRERERMNKSDNMFADASLSKHSQASPCVDWLCVC